MAVAAWLLAVLLLVVGVAHRASDTTGGVLTRGVVNLAYAWLALFVCLG